MMLSKKKISIDLVDVLRRKILFRVETIWNIGGRDIYKLALDEDLVDCIVATKINARWVVLNILVL